MFDSDQVNGKACAAETPQINGYSAVKGISAIEFVAAKSNKNILKQDIDLFLILFYL